MQSLKFIVKNSKQVKVTNILLMLAYCIGMIVVAYLYLRKIAVSIPFGILGIYMAHYKEVELEEKKARKEIVLFRGFIDMLNGSLRATSKPIELCVDEAVESMKDMPYCKGRLFEELLVVQKNLKTNYKTNFAKEMKRLSEVTGNKDIKNFVRSVETCYGVNTGSISDVIRTTSALIQEKKDIDDEIDVMVAEKKGEATIMLFIPAVMLSYYTLFNKEYMSDLYSNSAGFIIMLSCLMVNILVYFAQKKILKREDL